LSRQNPIWNEKSRPESPLGLATRPVSPSDHISLGPLPKSDDIQNFLNCKYSWFRLGRRQEGLLIPDV
jgi:hypothetical protein